MLVAGVGSVLVADLAPVSLLIAVALYGAAAAAAAELMRRSYPHARLGLCNVVTLARLVLVAALVVPLVEGPQLHWAIFAVALLALASDGIDGWLARRQGLVSDFGARFDMEVDSVLALVLALNAVAAGQPALALLLGIPRYAFAVAGFALPWLNAPLPARYSRKIVCVVQIATLIALQLPIFSDLAADLAVAAVCVTLGWSFGKDIVWLRRSQR